MLPGVHRNERGCTLFLHIPNHLQQFPKRNSTASRDPPLCHCSKIHVYSTLHFVKVQRDMFLRSFTVHWVTGLAWYAGIYGSYSVAIVFLYRKSSTRFIPWVVPRFIPLATFWWSFWSTPVQPPVSFNDGSCCHVSPLSNIVYHSCIICILNNLFKIFLFCLLHPNCFSHSQPCLHRSC